ncbi:GIY-YIG nuclease family protein [Terrisporobacter glycolicus]|uniref:GIY-YIG domain-containing protein n=1 Tax=Terrisporobacter glycolicus ATCC 14880 = DSM 1288 TaxID=1121315 RepID=A0ABZ2EUK6_9FIRM|nr:GIY-YIG nuclease family protein [Terrisporobacter glycolicus]
MCYTYIIKCKNNTLYTGYTTDIIRRMEEHKQGINSKYTRANGFDKLEIFFEIDNKSQAMKLEYYIKKLSKSKKIWIINNPELFIDEVKDKFSIRIGKINKS